MGGIVITKIADNIISPLGTSTDENFRAICNGKSMLRGHSGAFDLPEDFCGSLFNRNELESRINTEIANSETFTFFEKLCIFSAKKAIEDCGLSACEADVLFILSTTKGNVEYLAESATDERCFLAGSAKKIAEYFKNTNTPLVVSNACISGVCAQIAAVRALLSGRYRHTIVIGCDVLSKFIVSGFQSFKALSPEPCKPYDKERIGLNLGEAAGTIILSATADNEKAQWQYVAGAIHNDANHISGPSRTGEGAFRVIRDILKEISTDEIAFINTHGTSTAYNDEMESIALHRAQLDDVPVTGLKGNYGHTLGAAGIIETILSMKAVDNKLVLPTKGFENSGTSYPVNVSAETRTTDKTAFIKILSGFGGSNAGIAYRKGGLQ